MSLTFWNHLRSVFATVHRLRKGCKAESRPTRSLKRKNPCERKHHRRHSAFFELP